MRADTTRQHFQREPIFRGLQGVTARTALGPNTSIEMARNTGFSRWRALVGSLGLNFLYLLLYTLFLTVYVGEEYEHLGFIFVYGVGHIIVIVVAESIGPRYFPDPLDARYSNKMGPATLGVAVMGFFAVTSAYTMAKRYFGALMPLVLGGYELGCVLVLERVFVREFVQDMVLCIASASWLEDIFGFLSTPTCYPLPLLVLHPLVTNVWILKEKRVRSAYSHSNQGIVVSAQICLVHGMAEGGLEQWFVALAAVGFARWCSRNPIVPKGADNMILASVILFVADPLATVLPKPRNITEEELEVMAAARLRRSQICESEVMVAQFHTVLFMILLGNGLNYALGFCHEDYESFGRSLLWWPITDTENLCN
eukprot:Skav211514  [mRNA]  locus=scaffold352:197273:202701:+ [translate_table: standard]